jgi:hypothetical protein
MGFVFVCVLTLTPSGAVSGVQRVTGYRIEPSPGGVTALTRAYSSEQIGILEKLNRADLNNLGRLPSLVVPEEWAGDELAYSVLPARYPSAEHLPKLLVVFVPGQIFGAYESGTLVRWGPVTTGARASPTPVGLFSLNWKSLGHTSTVDPDWFMPWYFNFANREGLAFHQYSLPGRPGSHGCIRLLERDANWLYDWGEEWQLDASRTRVLRPGTPVFIIGSYDFAAPPPWRSPEWLAGTIQLPPLPTARQPTSAKPLPTVAGVPRCRA